MIPLILVLVTGVSCGVARWFSPEWMREAAARLMARAEAIEEAKLVHVKSLLRWRREFGVDR
ncbi:MAG TPA: hypothetical protein VKX49_26125 [Bryobacteraceae bacterium]|nr:hypothetical protein [Bryobacteraceae bacterium]